MTTEARLSVGVPGLDAILNGGLLPDRSSMIRGGPGTGKTILGLQYLLAGNETDEPDRRRASKGEWRAQNRVSDVEREFDSSEITDNGIKVESQLIGHRGILSGTPAFIDAEADV